MAAPLDRLLQYLPGAWSLARTIEDDRLGKGRFDGKAVFTPNAESGWFCEESGELAISTWRGGGYRRWLYRRDGDGLVILYPDGQALLHRFDFSSGAERARHTHTCAQDRYHAVFTLCHNGGFTLNYGVVGPAKRYRLHTAYAPCG
jgi:hypothetical protein